MKNREFKLVLVGLKNYILDQINTMDGFDGNTDCFDSEKLLLKNATTIGECMEVMRQSSWDFASAVNVILSMGAGFTHKQIGEVPMSDWDT